MQEVRVMIAGGGTGGHLIPALALAGAIERRRPGAKVFHVGTPRGPDRELLPASGRPYRLLEAPRVERSRRWRNALLPIRLVGAFLAARRLVRSFDPHAVVGTGGYVMVPVVAAALLRGRPVVLQEQNAVPGLATRVLARWADAICVQFPESAERLPGRAPVKVTGSPIPPLDPEPADFAERLDPGRATLGVFGGSQGSRALNDALIDAWGASPSTVPNVVWQTGSADLERARAAADWPGRVIVEAFYRPMAAVYPRLDLIICRAGAMTVSEITAWGIPSILVPYPAATDDHQTKNARSLEEAGAAVVVPEPDLSGRRLANLVEGLLAAPERRAEMAAAARSLGRPDAADAVASRVLDLVGEAR